MAFLRGVTPVLPSLLPATAVQQAFQQTQSAQILWLLVALLLGVASGALLERSLHPIRRIYLQLQKTYPAWYQRWKADRRERSLALLGAIFLSLLGIIVAWLGQWQFPNLLAIPFGCGMGLGLAIDALLRYRSLLLEDRPDTGPKAALHHVVPAYSQRRALLIGQIYLRFLLPAFAMLCLVALPLALHYIQLENSQAVLLLGPLAMGLAWGWRVQPESHFDIAHFRENAVTLLGLCLLCGGLLLWGIASTNPILLAFTALSSGYIITLY